MHRVLKDMLAQYVASNQRDWDEWVPFVLMAYRGSIHSSTGYSPYFLLHGRDQVLPIDSFIRSGRKRYDCDTNYASELMTRLKLVYSQAVQNTEEAKDKRIKQYNKKTKERCFVLGDLVYLKDMSAKVGISKKLTRSWLGPYRVVEVVGPVTYRIRRVGGRDEQVVHVNRLKEYRGRDAQLKNKKEKQISGEEEDEDDATEDEEEKERRLPVILPRWVEIAEEERRAEVEEVENESAPEDQPFLRRSTRARRAPDRLNL